MSPTLLTLATELVPGAVVSAFRGRFSANAEADELAVVQTSRLQIFSASPTVTPIFSLDMLVPVDQACRVPAIRFGGQTFAQDLILIVTSPLIIKLVGFYGLTTSLQSVELLSFNLALVLSAEGRVAQPIHKKYISAIAAAEVEPQKSALICFSYRDSSPVYLQLVLFYISNDLLGPDEDTGEQMVHCHVALPQRSPETSAIVDIQYMHFLDTPSWHERSGAKMLPVLAVCGYMDIHTFELARGPVLEPLGKDAISYNSLDSEGKGRVCFHPAGFRFLDGPFIIRDTPICYIACPVRFHRPATSFDRELLFPLLIVTYEAVMLIINCKCVYSIPLSAAECQEPARALPTQSKPMAAAQIPNTNKFLVTFDDGNVLLVSIDVQALEKVLFNNDAPQKYSKNPESQTGTKLFHLLIYEWPRQSDSPQTFRLPTALHIAIVRVNEGALVFLGSQTLDSVLLSLKSVTGPTSSELTLVHGEVIHGIGAVQDIVEYSNGVVMTASSHGRDGSVVIFERGLHLKKLAETRLDHSKAIRLISYECPITQNIYALLSLSSTSLHAFHVKVASVKGPDNTCGSCLFESVDIKDIPSLILSLKEEYGAILALTSIHLPSYATNEVAPETTPSCIQVSRNAILLNATPILVSEAAIVKIAMHGNLLVVARRDRHLELYRFFVPPTSGLRKKKTFDMPLQVVLPGLACSLHFTTANIGKERVVLLFVGSLDGFLRVYHVSEVLSDHKGVTELACIETPSAPRSLLALTGTKEHFLLIFSTVGGCLWVLPFSLTNEANIKITTFKPTLCENLCNYERTRALHLYPVADERREFVARGSRIFHCRLKEQVKTHPAPDEYWVSYFLMCSPMVARPRLTSLLISPLPLHLQRKLTEQLMIEGQEPGKLEMCKETVRATVFGSPIHSRCSQPTLIPFLFFSLLYKPIESGERLEKNTFLSTTLGELQQSPQELSRTSSAISISSQQVFEGENTLMTMQTIQSHDSRTVWYLSLLIPSLALDVATSHYLFRKTPIQLEHGELHRKLFHFALHTEQYLGQSRILLIRSQSFSVTNRIAFENGVVCTDFKVFELEGDIYLVASLFSCIDVARVHDTNGSRGCVPYEPEDAGPVEAHPRLSFWYIHPSLHYQCVGTYPLPGVCQVITLAEGHGCPCATLLCGIGGTVWKLHIHRTSTLPNGFEPSTSFRSLSRSSTTSIGIANTASPKPDQTEMTEAVPLLLLEKSPAISITSYTKRATEGAGRTMATTCAKIYPELLESERRSIIFHIKNTPNDPTEPQQEDGLKKSVSIGDLLESLTPRDVERTFPESATTHLLHVTHSTLIDTPFQNVVTAIMYVPYDEHELLVCVLNAGMLTLYTPNLTLLYGEDHGACTDVKLVGVLPQGLLARTPGIAYLVAITHENCLNIVRINVSQLLARSTATSLQSTSTDADGIGLTGVSVICTYPMHHNITSLKCNQHNVLVLGTDSGGIVTLRSSTCPLLLSFQNSMFNILRTTQCTTDTPFDIGHLQRLAGKSDIHIVDVDVLSTFSSLDNKQQVAVAQSVNASPGELTTLLLDLCSV